MTLYEVILNNAKTCPDKTACRYFKYSESYGHMLENIDNVASALAAHGIVKGDCVGICMPNSPEMLHIFYAVNKLGAVAVMLNPKSPSEELYRQIAMTRCRLLMFSHVAMKQVIQMHSFEGAKMIRYVCVPVMRNLPQYIRLALIKKIKPFGDVAVYRKIYGLNAMVYNKFIKDNIRYENFEKDDKADAVMVFSGGTNGTNKAVVHSSESFNASAVACLETEKPWPQEVSMLAILPCFHIFGLTVAIHLPFLATGCVVLVPFFNLGILTGIIKNDCPAFFPGVPTIFERLLGCRRFMSLAQKGGLNFEHFRHGFVGGDTLKDSVRDEFNRIIAANGGTGYISMGYGMSECCPICVNNQTSGEGSSVGILFDGMQVRIKNPETGENVPEGDKGEIYIASTYLMNYGIDEEGNITRPVKDENGIAWLATGDIGSFRNNRLFYECRQRRIIKVSGNSIFASSIENIISSRLKFAKEVMAVPVPHPTRGYGVYVFFVCHESFSDDETLAMAVKACKGRVIPYALPIGASCILPSEVERTALGKVVWGKMEKLAIEKMN